MSLHAWCWHWACTAGSRDGRGRRNSEDTRLNEVEGEGEVKKAKAEKTRHDVRKFD